MNILLIHGFEGSAESNWLPWLAETLHTQGHKVTNETFPNPDHPVFEEVMDFYRPMMKEVDVIVGHSLGPYIGLKLAEEFPLKKLIMVAPAIAAMDYEWMRKHWLGSDVDALETFIAHGFDPAAIQIQEKIAIFSDDDPYIPLKFKALLDETWEVVTLKGKGHFQKSTFPEILEWL